MDAGDILRSMDDVARLWIESGGGAIPVSGRSMRPTFEDASRVWMEEAHRVRFGDVLVYRNGTFLVAHRVVGIRRGPPFRTKGDGLPHLDPSLVDAACVHGRVVEIEREGKRYRTDRAGGRMYARLVGAVSAMEGLFYRIAYRLDLLLPGPSPGERSRGGTVLLRWIVRLGGRSVMSIVDRLLFKRMHDVACDIR